MFTQFSLDDTSIESSLSSAFVDIFVPTWSSDKRIKFNSRVENYLSNKLEKKKIVWGLSLNNELRVVWGLET